MKDKKLSAYFRRMSKKAAQARMEKIPPDQRKAIASNAAKARWAKPRKRKEGQ
jgi:hypothetical protein